METKKYEDLTHNQRLSFICKRLEETQRRNKALHSMIKIIK